MSTLGWACLFLGLLYAVVFAGFLTYSRHNSRVGGAS